MPRALEFCRLLREQGFRVTPAHTLAAVRALRVVDVGDREDFRLALRAVLVSGQAELGAFDDTFRVFWEGRLGERQQQPQQVAVTAQDASLRYSGFEVLAGKDFADFVEDEDRAALEEALRRIARKLATRRSRRLGPARRGGRVDLRRTMRRSLRFGGTALELARRKRDVRKTRLVLICDVSRSMDQYSRFLLQFVYAFQRALGRVESFVFGTRLTRVTRYFRTSSIHEAVERISGEAPDWAGGTRIGASLQAFNRGFRSVVDGSTTVVVLSDGLDTGDLELLDAEMARLRSRAHRLIWLNPVLGSP
ncbi:MAG: VWA domain-containing protein, partial [Chloroflexota bacterium]